MNAVTYGRIDVKATLTIEMDNAAFDGRELAELARILKNIAGALDYANPSFAAQLKGDDPCTKYEVIAKDINGNTVGWLEIE